MRKSLIPFAATLMMSMVLMSCIEVVKSSKTCSIKKNHKPPCEITGCYNELCTDQPVETTECVWQDQFDCYSFGLSVCKRLENGECGWTQTAELQECLDSHSVITVVEPEVLPCRKNGCSGDICSDEQVDYMCSQSFEDPPQNTCWLQSFAICERQTDGKCGWTESAELSECNANYEEFLAHWTPPTVPSDVDIIEELPTTDNEEPAADAEPAADNDELPAIDDEPAVETVVEPEVLPCRKNGCSGEICSDEQVDYSCAQNLEGPPQNTCWLQSFAVCERQANGKCGWTANTKLSKCNADYDKLIASWVPPKHDADNYDDEDMDIDIDIDRDH